VVICRHIGAARGLAAGDLVRDHVLGGVGSGFPALLPAGAGQIVVAGCEAHVCVLQTVLGLPGSGRRVLVAAGAVGSRDPADRAVAPDRATQHGAEIVTSEMALFEWLGDTRHPKFREVQKLLK
jgi:Isochorismatase family